MLPLPQHPRALGEPDVLADRRRFILDGSVEPLNRWVQGLRASLGPTAEVPWFDPADGGVDASILWLLGAPGPDAALTRDSSGFVSADNDDQTAENTWRTREEAGVARATVVHWNVVPYHLDDAKQVRAAAAGDLALNGRLLEELLDLLPQLRCVVLSGEAAALSWNAFAPMSHQLELVVTKHPGSRDLDTRPRYRQLVVEAWAQAARLAVEAPPQMEQAQSSMLPALVTGTSSVLVQMVGDSEAVVYGRSADVADLGVEIGEVPSALIEGVRTLAASAPGLASMSMDASGRLVRLTKESSQLLKNNEAVLAKGSGHLLGLVRDPTTKKIVGQLRFDKVAMAGSLAANLPALFAAIAMQQQMAQIEKQLAVVQERLDSLVDDRQRELDAGLATNLEILDDIYERASRRGEVEDSQWGRLVAIESDVRNLHKRTVASLDRLSQALDPATSAAMRTRLVAAAMKDGDLSDRLGDLVRAELAVTRWEVLRLRHELQSHPEESELLTTQAMAGITRRYDSLLVISTRLDDHLAVDRASQKLMDKLHILEQRRVDRLGEELSEVLSAYRANLETLGLSAESRRRAPQVPALSMGQRLGDLSDSARSLSGDGVGHLKAAGSKLPRVRRPRRRDQDE